MAKYVLRSLELVPPGGWRWKCPVHGVEFKAPFFHELLNKVAEYQEANGIEVQGCRIAGLQDEMCRQNGWGEPTCTVLGE